MTTRPMLSVLLALAAVTALPRRAAAGTCPPTPADWHPRVTASAQATLLETPVLDAELGLWRVFCSYSSEPTPRPKLRVIVEQGPGAGHELAAKPGATPSRFRIDLPGSGMFVLRIESIDLASAEPARLRVRVVDPAIAVPVTFELAPSPLDGKRLAGGEACVVAADDTSRCAPVKARGRTFLANAGRLEPGRYEIAWRREGAPLRHATADVHGERVAISFDGARLRILADGLPRDGRMYRLVLAGPGAGANLHQAFDDFGTWFDDVPPGHLDATLQSVPRIDPWDPNDPRLRWEDRAHVALEITAQRELVVRWSMPKLLAGRSPDPSPWVSVAGTPPGASRAPVAAADVVAFAARAGTAVAIGDDAHVWNGAWTAHALPATLARTLYVPRAVRSASLLDPADWVWVEGGDRMMFHNSTGYFAEALDGLYSADRPYPCGAVGVAALAADDVVAVGLCRANAPVDAREPMDGFIAERDATHWQLRRTRDMPLRAIAGDGDVAVAVGDRGAVAWRRGHTWTFRHDGKDDLVGVAVLGGRAVARTAGGSLVELARGDGKRPTPLGTDRDIGAHCLTERGVVALHRPPPPPIDGPSRSPVPSRVTLATTTSTTVLDDGAAGDVVAIACEPTRVWILAVQHDGQVVVRQR